MGLKRNYIFYRQFLWISIFLFPSKKYIFIRSTLRFCLRVWRGSERNIKASSFGGTKNCIGGGFWGFGRVYMNSSNFIYVVIIFLKLKIYILLIISINLSISKKILFQKM